jgi:hypothetical protein
MPVQILLFTVTYYVEAGCLGSKGNSLVSDFCLVLKKRLESTNYKFCVWNTQPLTNIDTHHFRYTLNSKTLSEQQATRYLAALKTDIKEFEHSIDDLVVDQIEDYLGRS